MYPVASKNFLGPPRDNHRDLTPQTSPGLSPSLHKLSKRVLRLDRVSHIFSINICLLQGKLIFWDFLDLTLSLFKTHLESTLTSFFEILEHILHTLGHSSTYFLEHTCRTIIWLRHWRARMGRSLACLFDIFNLCRLRQSPSFRRPQRLTSIKTHRGPPIHRCPKNSYGFLKIQPSSTSASTRSRLDWLCQWHLKPLVVANDSALANRWQINVIIVVWQQHLSFSSWKLFLNLSLYLNLESLLQ